MRGVRHWSQTKLWFTSSVVAASRIYLGTNKLNFPVVKFSAFIVGFLLFIQDLQQYSEKNLGPDLFCAAVTKVPVKNSTCISHVEKK